MKYLLAVVAFVLASCSACAGHAPRPPAAPRATARAAVDVTKDAWVLVARACLDTAESTGNDNLRVQCKTYLSPAHNLIQAAADAVDASWNQGAACDLARAAGLIVETLHNVNLGPAADSVRATVEDAMSMASQVSNYACPATDGGAP
jgi:hypothetical protein